MKKIYVLYFLIIIHALPVNAQQTYPIKETYDQFLEPYYSGSSFDYNNSNTAWWEHWGWTLLSYLRMYETTNDKSYLNKFIKHSYGIQLQRGNDVWNQSMNEDDPTIVLYTGQLIRPMAEFVYIVKNDLGLYNTNLLPGLVPAVIDSHTIFGYGDYANWLQGKVVVSLDYMISNYWIQSDASFSPTKISSFSTADNLLCLNGTEQEKCTHCPKRAAINFQANYAATMFFMGEVVNSSYTLKAENIVTHFQNSVSDYSPNHSYTWFHNPNQLTNCGTLFREDAAHGAIDIQIALIAYQIENGLYSSDDLVKFRNTFSKNIYSNSTKFYNNVFGTNSDVSSDQIFTDCNANTISANGSVNYFWAEVLAWMPLYKFDEINSYSNTPNVYDILLNHSVNLLTQTFISYPDYPCPRNVAYLGGGLSFYGISEVAKAQWDRECVNLSLFNRDLVYNQDFFIKNSLTVEPQSTSTLNNTNSFADPIISTPDFIIESNVTSTMAAGEKVELKAGFRAKAGCEFRASILNGSCSDGNENGRIANSENTSSSADQINSLKQTNTLSVYPNPTNDVLHVTTSISGENLTVKIMDVLGNKISETIFSENETTLDVSSLKSGIYFVEVINSGLSLNAKFVKE